MAGLYGEFIPPSHNQDTALPIRFFRDNLSIYDLLEESGKPFERARDESENPRILFPLDELDISNGCTESCEPF